MSRTLVAEVTPLSDEPFSIRALQDIIECFEEEGWTGVELKRDSVDRNVWSVFADADSDPYARVS
jgi:hypothetical protein